MGEKEPSPQHTHTPVCPSLTPRMAVCDWLPWAGARSRLGGRVGSRPPGPVATLRMCLQTFMRERPHSSLAPSVPTLPKVHPALCAASRPRSHQALTCGGLFLVSRRLQLPNWSAGCRLRPPRRTAWCCHQNCHPRESSWAFLTHSPGRKAQFLS